MPAIDPVLIDLKSTPYTSEELDKIERQTLWPMIIYRLMATIRSLQQQLNEQKPKRKKK